MRVSHLFTVVVWGARRRQCDKDSDDESPQATRLKEKPCTEVMNGMKNLHVTVMT